MVVSEAETESESASSDPSEVVEDSSDTSQATGGRFRMVGRGAQQVEEETGTTSSAVAQTTTLPPLSVVPAAATRPSGELPEKTVSTSTTRPLSGAALLAVPVPGFG